MAQLAREALTLMALGATVWCLIVLGALLYGGFATEGFAP